MFMKSVLKALVVALALAAAPGQSAFAGSAAGMARGFSLAPTSQFITTSRNTLAPFAFIRFCRDNGDECQSGQGASIVPLDIERRRELSRINLAVNRTIRPVTDSQGADIWAVDVNSGDCEDFALTKRRHLIAAGWPSRSLRIAVAETSDGEGHAVLVVKTSQGDLVLDNRTSFIRPWNRTDLTWLKIQSEENPKLWYEI